MPPDPLIDPPLPSGNAILNGDKKQHSPSLGTRKSYLIGSNTMKFDSPYDIHSKLRQENHIMVSYNFHQIYAFSFLIESLVKVYEQQVESATF